MSKLSSLFCLILVFGLAACSKDPSQGPVAITKSDSTAMPPTPSTTGDTTTTSIVNGKVVRKNVKRGPKKVKDAQTADDDDLGDLTNDLDKGTSNTPDNANPPTNQQAASGSSTTPKSGTTAESSSVNSGTGTITGAGAGAGARAGAGTATGTGPGAAAGAVAKPTLASKIAAANQIDYVDDTTAGTKIKQARDLLNQYPSGKKYAADLENNVVIKLGPPAQVSAIADLSGATFLAVEGTPTVIIASSQLSAGDLAQVLVYETQKISDENAERAYLKNQKDFKALIHSALDKYESQGLDGLQPNEQNALMFYAGGLFCGEARAFNRNLTLIKEGLPYSLDILKSLDLGTLVNQYFLTSRQLPQLSALGDLGTLTSKCLGQPTIVEFQTAIAPPTAPPAAAKQSTPANSTSPAGP